MLCGGGEGDSHYIWAGFDAMRVLSRSLNDRAGEGLAADERRAPAASCPARAPGVLQLESLESALARGARIHAELLGGTVNCGGHRVGGSMTAPEPGRACSAASPARSPTRASGPSEVDAINGHLTATGADPKEVARLGDGPRARPGALPPITATK